MMSGIKSGSLQQKKMKKKKKKAGLRKTENAAKGSLLTVIQDFKKAAYVYFYTIHNLNVHNIVVKNFQMFSHIPVKYSLTGFKTG